MADTSDPGETSKPLKHLQLAVDAPIRLQVGGRHFTTTKATLTEESGFFASLLSGRWDNALEDGSYFIDADPALFEHILRYLRRGVFPVFFDIAKGHDYHLYLSLEEEAQYFQITRLRVWLANRCYLKAVHVTNMATQWDEDETDWKHSVEPADASSEYFPRWGAKKVYLCPPGIPGHRGRPDACGRRCKAARGEEDDRYEEEPGVMQMLVMTRVVTFRPDVCVARDD
jgi:phytoene desaturase (3,4-didehydrolycopene-forming)